MNDIDRPRRVNDEYLLRIASHLTDRDRQIALDCYEHRVLTTEQLMWLHFTGMRTARHRLTVLYQLRVLDRFRPLTPRGAGSTSYCWVLDDAGAYIVAEEHGIERKAMRWRHASALALASSAKLTHHTHVNEFFARLAHDASRAHGALSEWYGERSLCDLFDGTIAPDGYGVLSLSDRPPIHLLLELDRGTEPAGRLREKATRYVKAIPRSTLRDLRPLIILAVPTAARAETATAATASIRAPLTVAVWSPTATRSPLAIVTTAAENRGTKSL
jgi:hypothetical protein